MDKNYQAQSIEHKWQQHWQHAPERPQGKSGYCIIMPPPNVTGFLHMGHGFQLSISDALIRYHHACGRKVLWQPGTDHAGIATQIVVERQLERRGQTREGIGREAFIEAVWQWKDTSGNRITEQMQRMGVSADWSRMRFTMDEQHHTDVTAAFVELYRQKLIYRGKRLVNWDSKLQTAVSDLEVVNETREGALYHIRYPLAQGQGTLTVATTRPETLFGDMAVAVHPDDTRYQHLIGQSIQLPLTERMIPIIADEHVDSSFGSGAVKITPAHDFNDYAMGQRHQLDMLNILHADGTLNEHTGDFSGLSVAVAREKVVATLSEQGLLERSEKHSHNVPVGERSGVVIEPYLTDQWFMAMQSLSQPALDAVHDGRIKFSPSGWINTYNRWLEDIQDWCLSRQLWWGHRIPAWYDDQGNTYVGLDEHDVRQHYQLSDDLILSQDEDVLDTWFSSALWPYTTLDYQTNPELFNNFYPSDCLITGFDIMFFWVARMIMMALHFTQEVPFKHVYFTGLIRDRHGRKMSKSKGNTIDPLDIIDGISLEALIEKRTHGLMLNSQIDKIKAETQDEFPEGISAHGTDALRFTFCALASTSRDIRFDTARLAGYRNFTNKIWNAARFILLNCEDYEHQDKPLAHDTVLAQWLLQRLDHHIAKTHEHMKNYRFDLLCEGLHQFMWSDFCDWAIELSKMYLKTEHRHATQHLLLVVFEKLLRLLHPIMPFITAEIWESFSQRLQYNEHDIRQADFPQVTGKQHHNTDEAMSWLRECTQLIRSIRSQYQIPAQEPIEVICQNVDESRQQHIEQTLPALKMLTHIQSLDINSACDRIHATSVIGKTQVYIVLDGLLDVDAEKQRLKKKITAIEKNIKVASQRLSNPGYLAKAPADVVENEGQRLSTWKEEHKALEEALAQLG